MAVAGCLALPAYRVATTPAHGVAARGLLETRDHPRYNALLRLLGCPDMLKIATTEFHRNIGRYQELALAGPVAVTRDGMDSVVLISPEEYRRLKRGDRQVMRLEDFSENDVAALNTSRAPATARAFDDEVKP